MPAESTPSRKGKDKYTVVFVPSDQSKKSRSYSVYSIGVIGVILAIVAIIVGGVILTVIYTPLGAYLPIASPELERLYGQKVVGIQRQLNTLVTEVTELQQYNQRLRNALGETALEQSKKQNTQDSDDVSAATKQTEQHKRKILDQQSSKPASKPAVNQSQPDGIRFMSEPNIAQQFPLSMPVLGYQSKSYNEESNHSGVDIVAQEGSPVVAAANGRVIYADWTLDDGYVIIVDHSDGFTTVYKHNKALLKNRGSIVKRGETIALLGNTGRTSSGPHLHFEVWNNGVSLNPMNYVITIQ